MHSQAIEIKTTATIPPETPEISRLTNSSSFFIGVVFIIAAKGKYRLVALHHGAVLVNTIYPTLRGAKIAFSKLFIKKACRENVISKWSPLYTPDPPWLDQKLKIAEAGKVH